MALSERDIELCKLLHNYGGKMIYVNHYGVAEMCYDAEKRIQKLNERVEELTEALQECKAEVERKDFMIDAIRESAGRLEKQ